VRCASRVPPTAAPTWPRAPPCRRSTPPRRAFADTRSAPVYHAASGSPDCDAAEIVRQLDVCGPHPALTIANGPHGLVDALGAAALYLNHPYPTGAAHAIVTAGGVWPVATWERWTKRTPLGDGAGALILSDGWGPLSLIATASVTDPVLAALRADGEDGKETAAQVRTALTEAIDEVLDAAAIEPTDVTFLLTPYGTDRPEHAVGRALGKINEAELERHIAKGLRYGHLGAADLAVGLHELTRADGPAGQGDHVLLLADGGRGTVSAALLELA
jgi:3-oxoacyl-[acyl-carrier-protein] synthase III